MKKTFGILSIICLMCSCIVTPVNAQEAFTIENLDIHMRVEEDGTYTVEEHYTLDFTSERHGFYRSIPTKYDMKWTNPDTGRIDDRSYYFPIDNVSCGKATCDKSITDNNIVLKIGDAHKTVIGTQQYTISYRVHTKDLDYHDLQMLYWNLVGNEFDTTIKHMTYTIEMPKEFDANLISTYTGGYRAAYPNLSANVQGTTITGELLEPLSNYEAATIMVNLPDGYFIFPDAPDYLLYAIIGSIVILVISLGLFLRFGKDDPVITTIEFKAPEGLDSAGVGYVIDAMVDNKDVLSLIIDWANRGYMKIHDDDDHHMKLEKIKDMDSVDTTPYECTFFHAIFKKKDLVDEEELKESYVSDGLSSAKTMIWNYFHANENRVYTSASFWLQIMMSVLIALPTILCSYAVLYAHYGMIEMTFPCLFLGGFGLVFTIPWFFVMRKRLVLKKLVFFLLWGLCFLLNAMIFTITAVLIVLWGPAYGWLYAMMYMVVEIVLLFILMFMDKRTKQGNRWLGQILGLKDFILQCEKDRLELLVEENPSAFYDILPYAYVLGVSDVWAKKFESLIVPTPDWYDYHGYYNGHFSTYLWWGYFHHSFHHVSTAASYVEPKGGSGIGGGSIGGGFSGGGFSGGGFGGGGGGSW